MPWHQNDGAADGKPDKQSKMDAYRQNKAQSGAVGGFAAKKNQQMSIREIPGQKVDEPRSMSRKQGSIMRQSSLSMESDKKGDAG